MATFSNATAPRHSSRTSHSAPPLAAERRRGTSNRASSRLNQTYQTYATTNDDASMGSVMDVDSRSSLLSDRPGRPETLFSKSSEMSVAFYAPLPVEVKQALKNIDFTSKAFTGEIDVSIGFSLIASAKTCYVWQHRPIFKGTPTCYIFPCPSANGINAPFHVLVPYGASRESGLILISVDGEVRFWENIAIGLAGGGYFSKSNLDLEPRERVSSFIRADPQTYLASTSSGRIFRLTLVSSGGRHHLASHPFARPQAALSLSSLLPGLWSSPVGLIPTKARVSAITLGAVTGSTTDVWAITDRRIQKWTMSAEGWEEPVLDQDLDSTICTAIRDAFSSIPSDDGSLYLELLDIRFEPSEDSTGTMVILVSHAGNEEVEGFTRTVPRRFALTWISVYSETFNVDKVVRVPYQSTLSSLVPMKPRIQTIRQGALVFIQFDNALAICARDSEYRDRLQLKSETDRILGIGTSDTEIAALVVSSGTMMRVRMDMDHIRDFSPNTAQAKLIKSTMMQAILYGLIPDNPLQFNFPPDPDEEGLMQAAEQLSAAVMESDQEVIKRNHDLGSQMTGRKERLSWLICFINENAVLFRMAQSSRQRLAIDAEKLAASHQLWLQHNERLMGGLVHSILEETVDVYMAAAGESEHEDTLRAFFTLKVADIGSLLVEVVSTTKRAGRDVGRSMATILPEANSVIHTVLHSAYEYRDFNQEVYGLELPMIDPWTSRPAIIDSILELFVATARFIDANAQDESKTIVTKSQLPDLAKDLFKTVQERLDWLESPIAAGEPGSERDRQDLGTRFTSIRADILETLRRHGHIMYAFELAEHYRDFRMLVALCHTGVVYPPEDNPHAERIASYVDGFGDAFTMELHQWYIEHGEVRVMFAQEHIFSNYMDRFFAGNRNRNISWIHDLGKRNHGAVAKTILSAAPSVRELNIRTLLLSVGKLSQLAQAHERAGNYDQTVLDRYHIELDFISVHQSLISEMKSALEGSRAKQPLDVQLDIIAKKKASKLKDMPFLRNVFKGIVKQLLQGKALVIEDAVDVLTLKDNKSGVAHYVSALQLLARDNDMPAARKLSGLRSTWRRIYLHDNWDKIRQTRHVADAELVERFRRTALFAALVEVLSREHQPEGYHLYMSDALPTPLASEIASRWPGMSAEEVGGLARDYVRESERLKELDLEDVYNRVKELAFEFVDGGGVVGDGDVSDDPTEIVGEEMEDDVFR